MRKLLTPSMIMSLVALVVALGGAAFSASGGNFILGVTNGSATPTVLQGPIDTRTLQINNGSTADGATALSLLVGSGHPPLKVNSAVKVVNLNADKLDGLASNQLVRIGRGSVLDFGSGATFSDAASVTLRIPQAGFVLVTGSLTASTGSVGCNPCYMHALFVDKTTSDVSPPLIASVGDGSANTIETVMAGAWVFPVTAAGSRTFALQTGPAPDGAAVSTDNPTIVAVYIPYGPTGTLALAGGVPTSASARHVRLGPAQSDGRRVTRR